MRVREILETCLGILCIASVAAGGLNLTAKYLDTINFGAELKREYLIMIGRGDLAWPYEENYKHSFLGGEDAKN